VFVINEESLMTWTQVLLRSIFAVLIPDSCKPDRPGVIYGIVEKSEGKHEWLIKWQNGVSSICSSSHVALGSPSAVVLIFLRPENFLRARKRILMTSIQCL